MKKIALVTGASRGVGKQVALTLNENDYVVYACGSSSDILDLWQEGIMPMQFDITDESEVIRAVEIIEKIEGRIDLVVNNAGLGYFKPVEEYESSEWHHMFNVNVMGVFYVTKHVTPLLKKQGYGTLINIASDISRRTFPGGSGYIASKYAVQGFTGSVNQELRQHGIRVGTINPGLIDTHFAGNEPGSKEHAEWLKPIDIANTVLWIDSLPKHVVIDELVIHPITQEYNLH